LDKPLIKYSVLIVDDSTLMRQMVARLFEESPLFDVVGTAENGQEGVDKVIELRPDLVVMDVEMPKMDGLAAVKQIMNHSPVPVIMLSSYTTESSEHTFMAMESGAVDYFHKDRLFNEYHDPMVTEDFLLRCQLAAKSRLPYIMGSFGSSKELAIKVLMEAIAYCMKIENDLAIAQVKLRKTLLKQRGLVLRMKREMGCFIHTMCEGELLGVKPEQVHGKELRHFFPLIIAERHEAFYRDIWEEQEGKSFETVWQGRTYLTVMRIVFDQEGAAEVISLIVDITEERSAEERMNFMTNHDYLTGLPNRRQLSLLVRQELESSIGSSAGIAFFAIGLDHFKSINDTIGYTIGDRLLQLIARRLIRCSRGEAQILRIGGSTFIYMMKCTRRRSFSPRSVSRLSWTDMSSI
jgi:CheY-like chemotaxis protein